MMNYVPALLLASIMAMVTSCGEDNAQQPASVHHDADRAVGVLVVQKRPSTTAPVVEDEVFCSGTLIAPDVVLTSARCAHVAATARVAFLPEPHEEGAPVLVRAAVLAPDAPGLPCAPKSDPWADRVSLDDAPPDADTVAADAAAGAATPAAACDALRARCGVRNIAAPDAQTWACLHHQPLDLLQAAGFAYLGQGHDLGLLFLEQPVHMAPAMLATPDMAQGRLRQHDGVRTSAFVRRAEDRPNGHAKTASLQQVERSASNTVVGPVQDNEVAVSAPQGLDATDRGGALMLSKTSSEGGPWYVAGVASRPLLQGYDTRVGMVYARLDAPALQWIAQVMAQACRSGERSDCHGHVGIVTAASPNPSTNNCSQGTPGWAVPALLSIWAMHRACRSRRSARARLMYGLAFAGLLTSTQGCGEAPNAAGIGDDAPMLQQAIVQGTPARDRYLAVGAIVKPGTQGADPYTLHCTGTLIAEDVVLTAAHCVAQPEYFQHVGRVVPKVGFRPGSDAGFGGYLATMQVRHTALHPAYWHASFAAGGSHNTFCPDGDAHTDRAQACDMLATHCAASDLASLRAITLAPMAIDIAMQQELARVRACVNQQDEALLRQAGYIGVQDDHDMALLFLERPVPNARIARLPTHEDAAALMQGATFLGVGYGEQHIQSAAGVSQRGEKHFMRNTLEEMNPWEIRLGMGPPQACRADSGGPMFSADPTAELTVLGVVSRLADSRSSNCDTGVIYGRVDSELDWITSTLEDACERGLRFGCHKQPAPAAHDDDAVALRHASIEHAGPPTASGCQATPVPAAAWVGVLAAWGCMRRGRGHSLGFRKKPVSRGGQQK